MSSVPQWHGYSDPLKPQKSTDNDAKALSIIKSMRLLRDFFAGHVEYVFNSRLGMPSVAVTDYITDMLVLFHETKEMFKLRDLRGQVICSLSSMLQEAQHRVGEAKGAANRYIGDYALFIVGYYPEQIKLSAKSGTEDSLLDFRQTGKRAYHIASKAPPRGADPEVLEALGDDFELYSFALSEVRGSIDKDRDPGQPLIIIK